MEDARIMPHHLVKGLPPLAPQMTKTAPLERDSVISSANQIKNMMFQSFTSKVPESFTFGLLPKAKNVLHNEAAYSLCSPFKAKSGPSLIHGRRNFSSGPPGIKNIPKMDSGTKVSSELGTEKRSGVDSDSSRSPRLEAIANIIGVAGLIFCTYNCVMTFYGAWKLRSLKALEKVE